MCNSAFILGLIIFLAKGGVHDVEKWPFIRDLVVYVIATILIIIVVVQGNVRLPFVVWPLLWCGSLF